VVRPGQPEPSPGCRPWRASHETDFGEFEKPRLRPSRPAVFQIDRRRAAEDRDRDLDARTLLVDFLDRAVERGERTVGDAHLLADLEGIEGFGRSTPSATWPLMRSASASGIGIGFLSAPRKPVTFGVFLIR
jgi:hypothetical protein